MSILSTGSPYRWITLFVIWGFCGCWLAAADLRYDYPDGRFLIVSAGGGVVATGQMIEGKRQGRWEFFDSQGAQTGLLNFKDNRLDGDVRFYYPSVRSRNSGGNLMVLSEFRSGQRRGEYARYSINGEIIVFADYGSGSAIQEGFIINENGKKLDGIVNRAVVDAVANRQMRRDDEQIEFFLSLVAEARSTRAGHPASIQPPWGKIQFDGRDPQELQYLFQSEIQGRIRREGGREAALKAALDSAWNNLESYYAAVKAFNRAWLLAPEDYKIYWGYAICASKRKDFDEAEELFLRALALNHADPKPQLRLDAALMYTFDPDADGREKAIPLLREAIELAPDDGKGYFIWAQNLARRGEFAEAWEKLRLSERRGFQIPPAFREALSKAAPIEVP